MLYKKVPTDLKFVEREKEVLKFWKDNEVFEKSIEQSEGKEPFTFYDGPPTANGMPHIGHILTRCIKDLIPRYKTMQGYDVLRKAGWDTHGLPVELEVEKYLGLDGKEQIEEYGVEAFIKECKQSVWKYKGEWEKMSDRVGFWADMDNPYITYNNEYIESEWWSLKKIYEKGLLYKGHKIVPYCPRCGTALSSHEVAQGYKDVKEKSAIAKFKVPGQDNTYILAWTTTPWTLPSNVALCINEKEEYALAELADEKYIMAKELVETVLGEEAKMLKTMPGKEVVGMEYESLYSYMAEEGKKANYVVADNYVTLTEGTGIVHIAPYGEDDMRLIKKHDLPTKLIVDAKGEFVKGTKFEGLFVKKADEPILKDLAERGLLFKAPAYEHSYPFCWRCDTPLMYYPRSTWFIKMTAVKDKLLENNNSINWYPENIKEGRMGNFLENVIDWGLSRERYWGTPLPIWQCKNGHTHVIGSREELKAMGKNVPDDIELHKPFIDEIKITCPECGEEMTRVSEVIDCWYDSGSMPFAQWHYPFENKETFEKRYPADFISEAIDQTRGWFYTLLAISTLVFDEPSFKNCIVLGHVQDKDGQKMSKHKGNVVDPWVVLDKQGADAVRWYFYSASSPWLPSRFYDEAVSESQRKFMGTLWNTYAFYILYAEIDKFDPTKFKLSECKLSTMDKWVLSRLNSLIKSVTQSLDNYMITEPARSIQEFVDELSNWYVRRGRERYWSNDYSDDKIAAYMTLYTVLQTLTRLIAPFVPFIAEEIYSNLVLSVDKDAPESVHLCSYPKVDEAMIDKDMEKNMDFLLRAVVLGRACRNEVNIKNRQPLSTMTVVAADTLPQMYIDIAADELNVKNVIFTTDAGEFMTYGLKPQLKTLGKKYGKLIPKINEYLKEADGTEVVTLVKTGKPFTFTIDDTQIELYEDDLLIEPRQKEGYAFQQDKDIAVALDTTLTKELIEEGYVREIISKIQTMRKDAGFEVLDHINVTYSASKELSDVIKNSLEEIMTDVLAISVVEAQPEGYIKQWNINGQNAEIGLVRV